MTPADSLLWSEGGIVRHCYGSARSTILASAVGQRTPGALSPTAGGSANAAPCASASSLAQAIIGWTRPPSPQSVAAMTRSLPTPLVKRRMRCATSSGCSTTFAAWLTTPGRMILPSGSLTSSQTRPFVLVPDVAGLERIRLAFHRQHDVHNVAHRNIGRVRPPCPATRTRPRTAPPPAASPIPAPPRPPAPRAPPALSFSVCRSARSVPQSASSPTPPAPPAPSPSAPPLPRRRPLKLRPHLSRSRIDGWDAIHRNLCRRHTRHSSRKPNSASPRLLSPSFASLPYPPPVAHPFRGEAFHNVAQNLSHLGSLFPFF